MLYLRQSTASQSVLIGPFVDSTDGVSAETGLTIANTDIRLSANGGNMFAKTSGGATHDEAGWYTITLDATDSATVGRLQLSVAVAGALPVFAEFQVLEEAVFDALYAASANAFTGAAGSTKVTGVVLVDTLTTYTGNTPQTGDTYALANGASGFVAIDTVVDAILVDTSTALPEVAAGSVGGLLTAATTANTGLANVTQWLGTAVATPTVAGVPEVDVTHILGDVAEGASGAIDANVVSVSGDTTAADTLELFAEALDQTTGQIDSGSFAAGAINAAAIATDAIGADEIAAGAVNKIADGVWDEILSGHTVSGSSGQALGVVPSAAQIVSALFETNASGSPTFNSYLAYIQTTRNNTTSILADTDALQPLANMLVASGAVGSTGNTTTTVHLDGLTFGDDEINDLLIVIYDDSASESHSRFITDWVLSTELATLSDALPFTPAAPDQFYVFAIRRDMRTQDITAAAANKLADHARRRTQANVETSDDGDALSVGSLYGLIQQAQESNTEDNAGKLTVYRTDGTTVLAQKDIATDTGSEPVVGIS
jgi:hypothetical protein